MTPSQLSHCTAPPPGHRLWRLLSALCWVAAALLPPAAGLQADTGAAIQILHEATPGAQPLAIAHSERWQTIAPLKSPGYLDHPVWLRFPVPADKAVVVIRNPWLDIFDLMFISDAEVLATYHSGSQIPTTDAPIVHPLFAFPVPRAPGAEIWVYIRHADTTSPPFYPYEVLTEAEFQESSRRIHLYHGLFYGVLLIMLLYNAVVFFGTRDRAFIYLVGYGFSLLLVVATYDGFGRLYLWPESPIVLRALPAFAVAGVALFLTQFAIRFLRTGIFAPRWTRTARVFQAVVLANTVLLVVLPTRFNAWLEPVLLLLGVVLFIVIGYLRSRQGDRYGRLFFIANGLMMLAVAATASTYLGWIPSGESGMHLIMLAAIIEVSLLSAALGIRLREAHSKQLLYRDRSQELARKVRELKAETRLAEEHRQLQKTLQQAQKLKTIGQMSGGIAHDFNNILASILGFSELALDSNAAADHGKRVKYLEEIRSAAERGAALVRQLLLYSRGTTKSPAITDLGAALRETAELIRGSLPPTVRIQTTAPETQVTLLLDPNQLQQLLVNLALNASEAMQERGEIVFALETQCFSERVCTSCLKRFSGQHAVIRVEDSGPGIAGNAADLFTPFRTTKPVGRGTGLGLSVVHGITHDHQGHVVMGNRAQGGCRVMVCLPLEDRAEPMATDIPRILLIEDDPSVGRYLESLLTERGYAVVWDQSPLAAMQSFLADPDRFDLVITDYLMPEETGLELAESLLELRPDLPIILTTGNENMFDEDTLLHSGVKAVFGKPLNAERLLARIQGLLAAARVTPHD